MVSYPAMSFGEGLDEDTFGGILTDEERKKIAMDFAKDCSQPQEVY